MLYNSILHLLTSNSDNTAKCIKGNRGFLSRSDCSPLTSFQTFGERLQKIQHQFQDVLFQAVCIPVLHICNIFRQLNGLQTPFMTTLGLFPYWLHHYSSDSGAYIVKKEMHPKNNWFQYLNIIPESLTLSPCWV